MSDRYSERLALLVSEAKDAEELHRRAHRSNFDAILAACGKGDLPEEFADRVRKSLDATEQSLDGLASKLSSIAHRLSWMPTVCQETAQPKALPPRRKSDDNPIVCELVERCEVQGRRLTERVSYGSTTAPMDVSEIEVLTRSIDIEVASDDLLPVAFVRSVECPDTELTTDVEFRLSSALPALLSSGVTATYSVGIPVPA